MVERLSHFFHVRWRFVFSLYNLFKNLSFSSYPLLVACFFIIPLLTLLYLAFFLDDPFYDYQLWLHVATVTLPDYLVNSLLLILFTGSLAMVWGITSAWILARYHFFFSRFFSWAIVLPFAIPSYIMAYAYTDFFDYSGPVQMGLRSLFSFKSPSDYYFPEIRSIYGCALVLSLNLYPYLYLFSRTSFLEQPEELTQTAKLFGLKVWQRFQSIVFPLSRPAVIIGVCIVFMETLSDFVTVEYFSVPTLSLGFYNTWINMNDIISASRIALITIAIILVVMFLEKTARINQKQYVLVSGSSMSKTTKLRGVSAFLAISFLSFPFVLGFLFPLAFISYYALPQFSSSFDSELLLAILRSVSIAFFVVVFSLLLSFFLLSASRIAREKRWLKVVYFFFSFGYSLPGIVLALGVLTWISKLDNFIFDFFENCCSLSWGLFFSQSGFSIVYAHVIRFSFVPLGLLMASFGNISPEMDQAAELYGASKKQVMRKIHLPLLRRALTTAGLIVFVDSIKEVPTTLILRPFDFETISTSLYSFIIDEAVERAAFPSLIILLLSLFPVMILCRQITKRLDDQDGG